MLKIGIIGLGFVGSAIQALLIKNKHLYEGIYIYDKYKTEVNNRKNIFNAILETDIVFICLPTLYDESIQSFNMNEMDEVLKELNEQKYKGILLIKSTLLPNYCSIINDLYPLLKIIHNPEFLSAKTATADFEKQTHIVLGHTAYSVKFVDIIKVFYEELFAERKNELIFSISNSKIAGLMKLSCNSFYAAKIQFFTELYLLCEKMGISYDETKSMMLKNNWIHPQHTDVPGHDNEISFGGACFPKDISALNKYMTFLGVPNAVINATINERNEMRND